MRARCDATTARRSMSGAALLSEIVFPPHFAACANSTAVNGSAHLVDIAHDTRNGNATASVACDSDGEFQATCSF